MAGRKSRIPEEIPEQLPHLPELLLNWYGEIRRDLPWRADPTPYHVWISEIMLQQTRIEAVLGYYARFLKAFPDIPSLAAATEEQVLKMWEGLGYYSRARNLMKAARICCEQYGGDLPADYEALKALPGIGDYTAGAVGSIAFHLPVPAVDGNVLRVLTRYLADDGDIMKQSTRRRMEAYLLAVMPQESGAFNQAIMELGERVCIPNGRPLCGDCPLRDGCLARREGTWDQYPVKPPKKPRRQEKKTVLLLEWDHRYAIQKRPASGMLAGLYEFPWLQGWLTQEELEDWCRTIGGSFQMEPLTEAVHIFSHVEWHMRGWRIHFTEKPVGDWLFCGPELIRREYPIPTAYKAYGDYL